jgi:CBS-domain-containing membrane protein
VGALVPVAPSFTHGALPLVEALDCLVGGAVVAALLQVQVARLWAERLVGVGDLVALPVLLDPADRLPPGALALDGGG